MVKLQEALQELLLTQSTCNSGGWHHIILGPAICNENQNMGHILPHAQRLQEQFLQNVADAFSWGYTKVLRENN